MAMRQAAFLAVAVLALHFGSLPAAVKAAPTAGCATVYVVNHGWHAGLVVASEDFAPRAFFRETQFADWRWLEFGWGDADFYQTPDAGLALAFRALFASTGTVMHVVGFDNPPRAAYPRREVVALQLPPAGYRAVLSHIKASFAMGADGLPILSKDGGDRRSAFYRALGKYHIRRTCNTWLAEALVKGGLPLDPDEAARIEDLLPQLRAVRWNGCKASREAAEPEVE